MLFCHVIEGDPVDRTPERSGTRSQMTRVQIRTDDALQIQLGQFPVHGAHALAARGNGGLCHLASLGPICAKPWS